MKATLLIVSGLLLAGNAIAQDAQTVLAAAQAAMGITGMRSIRFTASGYLADTGMAAGGNAPHPFVKSYEADIDFATPSLRVRIHRTNPDGTALAYGSEESQSFSGSYAWDQYPGEKSGPAFPPPKALAGQGRAAVAPDGDGLAYTRTLPQLIAARRMQILLTPPGFILAALANNAQVMTEGASRLISFSTSEGQRYVGTFSQANLLTRIVTTDPTTERSLDASFSRYKAFGGTRLPSHLLQTENRVRLLDLTISDVKPNEGTALAVPPSVQQTAQVDRVN